MKVEFEKYYKLVNDHWEELPMSDYEQTISVPHLAEQEIRLSCWIVLDGNKLIRAKNRDNAWRWVLDPLLGGSWLRLNDFRYCILWDEDTQQFIDVFKNIDLSMNERGYDLWAHTADMTKALFQGYSNEKLVPRYYADLTTNTVYDLETIGGESPQVVMLSGEDVIVISGLEEKEYLSKKEFAVYHSYYKDTSVQEIEMGEGHVLRLWHIGVESIRVYYQEDPDSRRSFSPLIAAGAEMIDLSVMPDYQD